MGQSIDCQPHFGHQVGRRKASYANHAAQVGEKTAVCLLSDRLLARHLYQDPNHSVAEICSMLGISRSTFFRYVKKAESAT